MTSELFVLFTFIHHSTDNINKMPKNLKYDFQRNVNEIFIQLVNKNDKTLM